MADKYSRIVGSLTVQLNTKGGAKATKDVQGFKSVVDALLKTDTSKLAQSAPLDVLAKSSKLAGKALEGLNRGQLAAARDWASNKKSWNEQIEDCKKLEEAQIEAAKAGETLFSDDQYKKLQKTRQEYEALESVANLKAKAMAVLNTEVFNFTGGISTVSKEATGVFLNIAGEIKGALVNQQDAITVMAEFNRGLGVTKSMAKGAFDVLKKGSMAFIKAAWNIDKPIKGLIGGALKIGSAFKEFGKKSVKAITMIKVGIKPLILGFGMLALKVAAVTAAIVALVTVISMLIPAIGLFVAAVGAITAAFGLAMGGIKEYVKLQDTYRLSTFRSMGSVAELSKVTAELGAETKLGVGPLTDTIKAMNNVGLSAGLLTKGFVNLEGKTVKGKQALKSAAKEIAELHEITGVSLESTSEFVKNMVVLTGSSGEATSAMMTLVDAQAKYGLATEDVSAVMKDLIGLQSAFMTTLDDTDPTKLTAGMSELRGTAKALGIPVQTASKLMNTLSDNAEKYYAITADKDMMSADLNKRLASFMRNINKLEKEFGGLKGQNLQWTMEAYDLDRDTLALMRGMAKPLNDEQKNRLKIYKIEEARNKKAKEFQKSTQTVGKMLQMIFAPLMARATEGVAGFVEEWTKLGDQIQTKIQPLFQKVGDLIQEIFGVKFVGEDSKNIVESVINGLEKVVEHATKFIKDIKAFIKSDLVPLIKDIRAVISGARGLKAEKDAVFGKKKPGGESDVTWGDWAWAATFAHLGVGQSSYQKEVEAQNAAAEAQFEALAGLRKKHMQQYLEWQKKKTAVAKKADAEVTENQKKELDKQKTATVKAKEALDEALGKKKKDESGGKINWGKATYGESYKEILKDMGYENVDQLAMFKNEARGRSQKLAEHAANKAANIANSAVMIAKAFMGGGVAGKNAEAPTAQADSVPGVVIANKSQTDPKEKELLETNREQKASLDGIWGTLTEIKELLDVKPGDNSARSPRTGRIKDKAKAPRNLQ